MKELTIHEETIERRGLEEGRFIVHPINPYRMVSDIRELPRGTPRDVIEAMLEMSSLEDYLNKLYEIINDGRCPREVRNFVLNKINEVDDSSDSEKIAMYKRLIGGFTRN